MAIDQIRNLLNTELGLVEQFIYSEIINNFELPDNSIVQNLGGHILSSGGKRLRPILVLLSSLACNYRGEQHIKLAAIIELIHTATLLHDDVVDNSSKRRGKPTANAIWHNSSSILVGDFLIAKAFELIASLNDIKLIQIIAKATSNMALGEVLQIKYRYNSEITEETYRTIIKHKTAELFKSSAQFGACITKAPPATENALQDYGIYLGNAFQIIDDVLDYSGNISELGKNLGADLAEGKTTLPLIYLLQHGNEKQVNQVRQAIIEGKIEDLSIIQEALTSSGALDYTARFAKQEAMLAKECLTILPHSPFKDAMASLADFAVARCS